MSREYDLERHNIICAFVTLATAEVAAAVIWYIFSHSSHAINAFAFLSCLL
jgi:hypothetical protein